MIRDLRSILEDWDYEPGKISVRKIVGADGSEKIQTRIDLGLLQIEPQGRPDGKTPHGAPSLLDYFEQRLVEHVRREGDDEMFTLSPEECRELRHEGYLYYQRYLSLFVLEEYGAVVRDTARNLRLMDFCNRYAASERDQQSLEPQRPYVLMMYSRARAYVALESGQHDKALWLVDRGVEQVTELLEAREEDADESRSEIKLLRELREEILLDMPEDAEVKLKEELREAVEREDYERAAEIRDQLQQCRRTPGCKTPAPPPGH